MKSYRIDLKGKIFGKWTVLEVSGHSSSGEVLWSVVCECGNTNTLKGSTLRRGKSTQCKQCSYKEMSKKVLGKEKPKWRTLLNINEVYGKLKLLSYDFDTDVYFCSCDCGELVYKPRTYINNSKAPNCGCYASEIQTINKLTTSKRIAKRRRDRCKFGERYRRAKKDANKKGVPFTLTKEAYNVLINRPCVYGNQVMETNSGSGLDQKIAGLGYTTDNSVPCCWRHNNMKGCNLSYDDMLFLLKHRKHLRQCANYTYLK